METSAKSGLNVEELFCRAAKILYEESIKKREVIKVSIYIFIYIKYNQDIDPDLLNQVKLSMKNSNQDKKKKCC